MWTTPFIRSTATLMCTSAHQTIMRCTAQGSDTLRESYILSTTYELYSCHYSCHRKTPVTTEPVTVVVEKFSDLPAHTKCPNCAKAVTTQVSHEPGTRAWICCLLFFLCGYVSLSSWSCTTAVSQGPEPGSRHISCLIKSYLLHSWLKL